MTIAQNFPAISPSLLLDFANVQALDSRITFTRATTATYYGTRTALAEQNLVLQSQTFDNASWGKIGSTVTADSTAAPDGTTTADTIVADGASSSHYVTQSFTAGATQKVLSVFLKAGTNNFAQIWNSSDSNGFANFDLSSGTVGTVGSSFTASIVSVGSGWYRCIAITSSAAANTFAIAIVSSGTAVRNETNALATTVFAWGAQLEQRSFITAYQVTTTQPISNYVPVLETAASNVARFDHNPVTFESLGLLIEEQRTNLLLQSEDLDTTWSETRATLSLNSVIAPNGTLTADVLIASTDNNTHFTTQTFTGTATSHTFSAYAKANGLNHVALRLFNGATQVGLAYYNLSTGATGTVTAGTASIQSVGNGWYRCSLTATLAASASCTADIFLANADNTNSFAGNAFSGVSLWGFQVEAGVFATSYIPTVASQVTRAADSANMTGTNFSSWYNQAEGSVYAEFNYSGSTGLTVEFYQTTSVSNRWYIVANNGSNRAQFVMRPLGSVQADISDAGVNNPPNTMTKIAGAYKVNDFAFSQNGRAAGTDTSGYVTNDLNQLVFGNTSAGNVPLNGRIKKLAYYPKALTATQIQALTS